MSGETVGERYRQVSGRVAAAARRAGRDPGAVRLVVVTKTQTPERVRATYDAGARVFGENYVQEAAAKIDVLPRDAEWHMIGHLQSNKARKAVDLFSWIHTVDRPSVGRALERAAGGAGGRVDVLLQVNVAGEASKSGASPDEAITLARRAGEWPHLQIRGLMAIPPFRADPEDARADFRALRALADRIREMGLPGVAMDELSMGMSHDFEVAIEEGATWVRVGSAIFGPRDG